MLRYQLLTCSSMKCCTQMRGIECLQQTPNTACKQISSYCQNLTWNVAYHGLKFQISRIWVVNFITLQVLGLFDFSLELILDNIFFQIKKMMDSKYFILNTSLEIIRISFLFISKHDFFCVWSTVILLILSLDFRRVCSIL